MSLSRPTKRALLALWLALLVLTVTLTAWGQDGCLAYRYRSSPNTESIAVFCQHVGFTVWMGGKER